MQDPQRTPLRIRDAARAPPPRARPRPDADSCAADASDPPPAKTTSANPGLPPQSARADHGRRQPRPATHPSSISRDRTVTERARVVRSALASPPSATRKRHHKPGPVRASTTPMAGPTRLGVRATARGRPRARWNGLRRARAAAAHLRYASRTARPAVPRSTGGGIHRRRRRVGCRS
jgi:hypothetical protein